MAIADILTKGIAGWKKSAKKAMQDWVAQSPKNEEAERSLHDMLSAKTPRVAQVVKDKNLIAFTQMLKSFHYKETRVAELMVEGFPVVGNLDRTEVFEDRPVQDVVQGADERWLYLAAKQSRKDLITEMEAQEVTPC